MRVNAWLAAGLMTGLCIGSGNAQTGSGAAAPATGGDAPPVRNSTLGDPGVKPARRMRRTPETTARAHQEAVQDQQPPGTENGNQPDRAAAGGGGR